jgi:ketosteroid isomerase-like protein
MRHAGVRVVLIALVVAVGVAWGCRSRERSVGANDDREALVKTSVAIRDGFARGDVAAILAYHHPDVVKALSFDKTIHGRDALGADLTATLQQVNLEWKENRVESLWIHGDTAVEQTVFVIKGTPKNGNAAFLFRGRAQVVYVRYKQSPTGWASIRELVQPAS